MKRFILLVAILSLVLAACGGGGSSEPTEKETPSGPVNITLWHEETGAGGDGLGKLADRFNASQDEVKVKSIFQGDELDVKLLKSMSTGDVPTIAYLAETYTQQMIDSGEVTPIQQYVDRDKYDLSDFAPAAVAYFTISNTLYAMPHGLAVPLMYYNKPALREVGVDPDHPPRDLDEAQAVSEKLLQRDSAGNVTRSGFALDIHPWYLEVMLAGAGELYVNNNNGRDGFATAVAFDNEAGRKLFQWWHDMAEEGLLLNTGRGTNAHANALMAISAKRAVMAFSISGILGSVVDLLAKGESQGVNSGVAPVPGIPGKVPEGSPGVYSRSLWIMSGRPQAERDAAWTFIKWLMEPEQQAEWFAGSGYLPVRNSAYDLPAAKDVIAQHPQFQVPVDLFAKTATTSAALGPLLGCFPQVHDAVAEAIESMLVGGASPDEAMAAAVRNANAAIKDYNDRMGR